jgi:phage/plasmid-like protein (TIGR03299 family)
MAHEISIRKNGFAEMAYVGEKPWHPLGQKLTKGAPLEVWEQEAGFNWEAKRATVQYEAVACGPDGSPVMRKYEGRDVIYRSDTLAPVGDVSSKYQIVQPKQTLGMFRKLVEENGWWIHTAGVLRGGARLWVMASHDSLISKVAKNDAIKCHMLVATSLDGSLRTLAKPVTERVVCANTLAMALAEDGGEVSMSHRSAFDLNDMADSLDQTIVSFTQFTERMNELAETMVGTDEALAILRNLFGAPTVKALNPKAPDFEFQRLMAQVSGTDGKVREQRSVSRCMELFSGEAPSPGAQLPGSVGTAWGLLNTITFHVDHELGRTADGRMDSAWFGRGETIKGAALAAIAEA